MRQRVALFVERMLPGLGVATPRACQGQGTLRMGEKGRVKRPLCTQMIGAACCRMRAPSLTAPSLTVHPALPAREHATLS